MCRLRRLSRSASCALLACLLTAACAKKHEDTDISVHVRCLFPRGWEASQRPMGADRTIRSRKEVYEIRLQLLGGEGSLYESPKEFMRSFRARKFPAPEKAPELKRWVEISGKKLPLYSSRYRMAANDPHDPKAKDRYVYDEFAVVPAGKRFLVLGASKSSYDSDESGPLPAEWEAFLKSFELLKPYE